MVSHGSGPLGSRSRLLGSRPWLRATTAHAPCDPLNLLVLPTYSIQLQHQLLRGVKLLQLVMQNDSRNDIFARFPLAQSQSNINNIVAAGPSPESSSLGAVIEVDIGIKRFPECCRLLGSN